MLKATYQPQVACLTSSEMAKHSAASLYAGEGTVESVFCQNFTAGLPGIGETISVPLKEDGDDIMVTEENRREYVDLFVDFFLSRSVNKQVIAYIHVTGTLPKYMNVSAAVLLVWQNLTSSTVWIFSELSFQTLYCGCKLCLIPQLCIFQSLRCICWHAGCRSDLMRHCQTCKTLNGQSLQ